MASIHSTAENDFIAKTVYPGKEPFYIGANDMKSEGTFEWTDSIPLTFKKFYPGEPNDGGDDEDCVQLGRYPGMREAWNDISCSLKFGFVCKFKTIPIA